MLVLGRLEFHARVEVRLHQVRDIPFGQGP